MTSPANSEQPPVGGPAIEAKNTVKPSRKRTTPKPDDQNRQALREPISVVSPVVEVNEAPLNSERLDAGAAQVTGEISRPGISAVTLCAAGIRVSDTPEPDSIEIPYHDLHGKPTGFRRWRLPRERPNGQKYYQDVDTGTRAYIPPQFHSLPPGGDLVIVEGEFKALALIEAGIKAIGLPSFNTYTRDENDEPQLLAGISEAIQHTKPDRILFLGDSDTATNYEFARNAVFLSQALGN